MSADPLWPRCAAPSDLLDIEAVALAERCLPASTYDVVIRAGRSWPDRVAVTVLPDGASFGSGVRYTFADLAAAVTRSAKLLRAHGIGRTDAVALISPNCAELLIATLAAEAVGIAAPINGSLTDSHIGDLIRLSGARVLIAAAPELDPRCWDAAVTLASAGLVDTVFLLQPSGAGTATGPAPEIDGATVAYLSAEAVHYDDTPLAEEIAGDQDVASVFHTGGTTGTPKLAAHTHGNEVADAWMVAIGAALGQDSVIFAALPLFHVNALIVTVLAPLLRGQSVVWAGPLGYRDPTLYPNFWALVEHHQVAAMSAVPTVYAVLAQCPVTADISSLTSAVVGASALPEAVRSNFQTATGVPLVEGYGLTEATCASVRSFAEYPRPGSVGQRMPYQHLKTVRVDDDGTWHDLPTGETGTLLIAGPTVFPGYVVGRGVDGYRLDGLGMLRDGWLNTGDLARVDSDGFVYLKGRAKDLIIRGGHNIDPALIEDALLTHPDVTGAAAVGRPDAHAGEVPVGYVSLRSGATVTGDQLAAYAGQHVAERAAAPKTVTVMETLPLTSIGKPYKLPLRASASADAISDALAECAGVTRIHGDIDGGAPIVRITLAAHADRAAIAAILNAYALDYQIETS